MSNQSVILLTTGVPGAGKTYVRASRFLLDDFLINTKGIHISNFPLNIDRISEDVSKKLSRKTFFFKKKNVSPEDIRKRLEVIPDWVLQSWRNEISGPWEYFQGRDLRYCHIAIDEIQNYVSPNKTKEYLQKWDEFLGEIRHRGCTFEGLTQDIDQVDKIFTGRAAVRLEIVPCETLRDPYFKIPMLDWYELKASFTGSFHKTVFEVEKRKSDKGWKTNNTRRFLIVPEYFVYYNSFSASMQEKESGTVDEDRTPLYQYQQRSRAGVLFWFIRRNFLSLFWRFLLICLFVWLFFFGGFSKCIDYFVTSLVSGAKSNSPEVAMKSEKVVKYHANNEILIDKGVQSPEKNVNQSVVSDDTAKSLAEQKDKYQDPVMFRIVFMSPETAILQNGIIISSKTLKIQNPGGLYHDQDVKKFDYPNRIVYLLDVILRM